MSDRELMQQALDALVRLSATRDGLCNVMGEIKALRARLAQPEAEQQMRDLITHGVAISKGGERIDPDSIYKEPDPYPVAWRYKVRNYGGEEVWTFKPGDRAVLETQPLYPSVPHRQQPVGYFSYFEEEDLWEQCMDSAAGQDDVFPLYR